MAKRHEVQQGDGISRIAYNNGFFWETVWADEANAGLRELRQNPEVLLPGDVVAVPDLRPKREQVSTNRRLRVRLKGVPARLQVRLVDPDGEPRIGLPCEIEIDGKHHPERTDADGWLRIWVPPNAVSGTLTITGTLEKYELALGHIDPLETVRGAQSVLRNLGYIEVQVSGELDSPTVDALKAFQESKGLKVTGELDGATVATLKAAYFG